MCRGRESETGRKRAHLGGSGEWAGGKGSAGPAMEADVGGEGEGAENRGRGEYLQ